MAIETYDRNPAAQQLGGTTKLSGSDPVAGAISNLGGQIQNVGDMFAKFQQVKDRGASLDGAVSREEAQAQLEQNFNAVIADPNNNSFSLEDKPQYMQEGMDLWRETLKEGWTGSKGSLDEFLQQDELLTEEEQIKYKYDVEKFKLKKSIVQQENAGNKFLMSALESYVSGDEEGYKTAMTQAVKVKGYLEEAYGDPSKSDAWLKQGFYSATARLITNASPAQVNEVTQMIDEKKGKFSPSQYQELKRLAEAQKRNTELVGINLMQEAQSAASSGDANSAMQLLDKASELVSSDEGRQAVESFKGLVSSTQIGIDKENVKQLRKSGMDLIDDRNISLDKHIRSITGLWRKPQYTTEEKISDLNKAVTEVSNLPYIDTAEKFAIIDWVISQNEPGNKNWRQSKEYDRLTKAYETLSVVGGGIQHYNEFGSDLADFAKFSKAKDMDSLTEFVSYRVDQLTKQAEITAKNNRVMLDLSPRQLQRSMKTFIPKQTQETTPVVKEVQW